MTILKARESGILSHLLVFVLLLLLISAGGMFRAEAKEIPDKQKKALKIAIFNFNKAVLSEDYPVVVESSMTPLLLEHYSRKLEVDIKQIKAVIAKKMAMGMRGVKIRSFSMDQTSINFGELADGTPYALIPTKMLLEIDSQKVLSISETLGLIDDGKWYLVRIDNLNQVSLIRTLYPLFRIVKFNIDALAAAK
jgi:hypothetical protein